MNLLGLPPKRASSRRLHATHAKRGRKPLDVDKEGGARGRLPLPPPPTCCEGNQLLTVGPRDSSQGLGGGRPLGSHHQRKTAAQRRLLASCMAHGGITSPCIV